MNMIFQPGSRTLLAITVMASLALSSPIVFAYNNEDLQKLLTTNACNNCDLSRADLSNKDLYGATLIKSNLSEANLTGTLLRETKLSGANFNNAILLNAKLQGATLSGANLSGANLSGAKLINIVGDAATFSGANLSNADLTSAVLSCTDPHTLATCVKLINVQGQSALFNDAVLSGANLSGADFSLGAMRNTNLASATLTGTILCKTDLSNAVMPNNTIYNGSVTQFGADASCQSPTKIKSNANTGSNTPSHYCTKGTSIFSYPENVHLGITPTVWSNSDDLSIDLVPAIPYQQIMSEIALSGFKGTQNSPKFPKDIDALKHELNLRGITISEPWVGTFYTLGKSGAEESQRIFNEQLAFMKKIGGNVIVVAEMGGAVHQQPIAPIPNRPKFSKQQWKDLLDGLNNIGKQAHDAGMKLTYHFHIGTGVEDLADIDKLMAGTNPKYVHLLLDTGHAKYAGIDPLALAKKYGDRISHVHLKNIRQSKLEQSLAQGWSFLDSVRAGVFTVPGDSEGVINFNQILEALAAAKFQGWLVVEAEQDPNKANPLTYALMARKYLCDFAGL